MEIFGITWQHVEIPIPKSDNAQVSAFIFDKNMAGLTHGFLTTFERNPVSLPQTQTILQGQSIGGTRLDDVLQVRRYLDAAKYVKQLVSDGKFELNVETACNIHRIVAAEEALTWGTLRTSQVNIRGVDGYTPPATDKELGPIAEQGFQLLNTLSDPKECAIITFLFMARTQFFFDGNKRTASLMMNGELVKNSFNPITFLPSLQEEFNNELSKFYNTGEATNMLRHIAKNVQDLY